MKKVLIAAAVLALILVFMNKNKKKKKTSTISDSGFIPTAEDVAASGIVINASGQPNDIIGVVEDPYKGVLFVQQDKSDYVQNI